MGSAMPGRRALPGERRSAPGWIRAGLLWGFLAGLPVGAGGQATPGTMEPSVGSTAPGPRVEAVLQRPLLGRIHWGIVLMDPADGRILYERNADLPFVPASNMKIPVTWAALELLGPSHRYVTPFHADAPPREGVIHGDLVLRGSGDPSLGPPFHPSAEAALQGVARRLAEAGVRRVEGALVVDASAWDSTSVPTGWLVGNLSRGPAATGGAFAVGHGLLDMTVTGGSRPGDPARVSWRPLGTNDFVESRVRTGGAGEPAELEAGYLPESRRWVLEGRLPPGARRTLSRPQRDPVRQGAHALLRAVEAHGIPVRDGVQVVWSREERPPAAVEVARFESPPLMALVGEILAPSQNWMTEQLVRTLGASRGEEGSWEEGFRVIHDLLRGELGVDSLDIYFRDGSGLAGYNLVTPRALARILARARQAPWGGEYRGAMATPGTVHGTLTNRLPDLRGRLFAKTGSITHANALSGYLVDGEGRELVFVVLTNAGNQPAARIRSGIDDVVRAMAGG